MPLDAASVPHTITTGSVHIVVFILLLLFLASLLLHPVVLLKSRKLLSLDLAARMLIKHPNL